MTRRHDAWKALREIAAIRSLQTQAAEGRAAAAARNLTDRDIARQQAEARRQQVERSWEGSMTAQPLSIDLAVAWSQALRHEDAAVVRAAKDYDDAAAKALQRATELHGARILQDGADEMAQAAQRAWLRQLEEGHLADSADRDLQGRHSR
jgi:hypothetical protein